MRTIATGGELPEGSIAMPEGSVVVIHRRYGVTARGELEIAAARRAR